MKYKLLNYFDKAIANLDLNFYACNYDLVLHDWDSKSSIWNC